MNNIKLVGRVNSSTGLKYTSNGYAVCNVDIITDIPRKRETEIFSLACWGDLAEEAGYLQEDDLIAATGGVYLNKWVGKTGKENSKIAVNVDKLIVATEGDTQEILENILEG